jgi:hypothetical protein
MDVCMIARSTSSLPSWFGVKFRAGDMGPGWWGARNRHQKSFGAVCCWVCSEGESLRRVLNGLGVRKERM